MDNLTHSLVGLVAAKSGLERLSPGATTLCVLAANSPDSDLIVLLFADRWTFLHHHRGITHAIVGVISLSVIFPLLFYAGDKLIAKLRARPSRVKFPGLLVASLIATATHPILDWTNNYGIRFLLPWDDSWSYGDLVFIVDPFIWLVLGGTAFLLTSRKRTQRVFWSLLAAAVTVLVILAPQVGSHPNPMLLRVGWVAGLVTLIVFAVSPKAKRVEPHLASIGVSIILFYWAALAALHVQAMDLSTQHAQRILVESDEKIVSQSQMPTLANPAGWECIFETDRATYKMSLSLLSNPGNWKVVRYPKPEGREARLIDDASKDRRAQILLEFARYPVWRVTDPDCTTQTLVQLADLRYTEPGRTRGSFSLELPVECSTPQVIANDE